MVVVAYHFGEHKNLLVGLGATTFGIAAGLYLERRIERGIENADRTERIREWMALIGNGASASRQNAEEIVARLGVAGAKGRQIPAYRPDGFLASTLNPIVMRDLLGFPGLVDAHRSAVFELAHFSARADVMTRVYQERMICAHKPGLVMSVQGLDDELAKQAAKLLEVAHVAIERLQRLEESIESFKADLPLQQVDG